MYPTHLRRGAAALAAAGLTAGTLLLAAPAGAAPTTVDFNAACWGKFKSLLDNTNKTIATGVAVDAPASVVTGSTVTYRLQPNTMTLPRDGENLRIRAGVSRLKFDYEVPAGFVSATVVPGTEVNLGGTAPTVVRVGDNGSPSATGSVLRLSGGNNVIGNGTGTSDGSTGGIQVTAAESGDTSYRLPAIDVTVVAGAAGSTITPKLRTAGAAADYKSDENFFTSLVQEKDPVFGVSYWSATRCVPKDGTNPGSGVPLNAGGGALATIAVTTPPDATTGTTLAVPATAHTGTAVDLTATVAPSPAGGTVQFLDGGAPIGTPVTVAGGVAVLAHEFVDAGDHSITAEYSGAVGSAASTAAARTVSVSTPAPNEITTTTTLTAPSLATRDEAITLTATVAPGQAGGTVQFFDGTTAIGGPVALVGGTATLSHPFSAAGAHGVTAVYSGGGEFLGSTSDARVVNVTAPATPGGEGSSPFGS